MRSRTRRGVEVPLRKRILGHCLLLKALLAVSLVCGLAAPRETQAAHTLDTSQVDSGLTGNPATLTYTCGSGATVLVLHLTVAGTTARTGGAPTYNGVAMTQAGSTQIAATEVNVEMWYLLNPVTGTAASLDIPNSGARTMYALTSSAIAQAGFTSALDVTAGSTGTTANPSQSLTTTVNGDFVTSLCGSSNNSLATGVNKTQYGGVVGTDHGAFVTMRMHELQGTLGATTHSCTLAAASNWGFIVAAFKEVAASCTHAAPTVTVSAPTTQTTCRGVAVNYAFTVKNNCSGGGCGNETFALAYGDGAANFVSTGPASITLAPGATSANQTLTVTPNGSATGTDTTTITASLAGHTNGTNNSAQTTVDTTAPSAPTVPTCTGTSSSQIDLTWTNPGADFSGALVVRGPAGGAAPTFVPASGTTYVVGAQGSDYIVAVGAVAAASDTGLAASTTYAYRIYAYDACKNYSTALATSCATTSASCTHAAPTVTVSAPTAQTGCRNGSVTYTFTVKNNCTASCGNETFALGYTNSAAGFTSSGGPASVTLAPGATSAALTFSVNIGAAATGPDTATITASLAGHTNGTATGTTSVDITAPSAPTVPTCTGASSSQINLSWTNPGADFSGALVVRGPAGGVAPTFVPVAGTTYAAGAQGSDYIVVVGAVAAASDTGLAASTTYAYRIYAYDACKNYSTSLATSCATLAGSTTTVGNGTNPGAANPCPGGAATMLDAFTLQTSAGTDTVTAVTVTLAGGTAGGIGLLEITNDAGGTVYGTFTNPSGIQTVTLSTTISATTTSTQYKVRITPRSHATMPAIPGASYAVTGMVTGLTSTNGKVYNDSGSATVTIDNASPANATWGGAIPGDAQVGLNWTNPGDADFSQVVILRNTTTITDKPVEGTTYIQGNTIGTSTVRYVGGLATFTDTGLVNGTAYYYAIFAKDTCGNHSTGVVTGPFTPVAAGPITTTAGTATAAVSSCTQITVTAPFTGDGDMDGSVKVEYNTTNTWPGTTACAAVSGPSPRTCIITGLTASTAYYVRVTYTDPDGIAGGTAIQVLAGTFTTTACGADQVPPVLTMLTPTRNAVISGADTFKIQVFDVGGLNATNPVKWSVDSQTAGTTTVTVNANYNCGSTCWVYEIAVPAQTAGAHYLCITATDAANNVGRISWPFVAKTTKTGSGDLLRRTHSSELCLDCHALQTHSAQHTDTKYGNWAVDCQTCHTAHNTKNIYLVREKIQTPNSGVASPVFLKDDRAGGTNPLNSYLGPDNAIYTDGICEVCHTKTNHYRNDTSGGDHTHNSGARCVDCHKHTEGFKGAGCNGCHNGPPSTGRHAKHWGVATLPASYTDTAGQTTAALYGLACAKCHSGTHINDTHAGTNADPYWVQVAFDNTADPKNPTPPATYTAGVAQTPDLGPSGDYWRWTTGTCGSLYCHSNAAPVSGTNSYMAPVWDASSTLACNGCHNTVAKGDSAVATDLSAAHGKHIQSTAVETGSYSFKCDECHALTVKDNPNSPWLLADADLADKTKHVMGTHSISFSPTSIVNAFDQSAGTYAQAPGYTCSNTYCHSNGQDRVAPFTSGPSIAWTTTAAADCSSCHGGNATAAVKMGPSNDHAAHMDQAAYLGTNFACGRCHNATVATGNDRAITTLANHVNGVADISFADGGTYSGSATKTCSSVYCHSNGTETPDYRNTNLDWDAGFAKANDCLQCHGTGETAPPFTAVYGEPNYVNNTASDDTRNSHQKHVSTVLATAKTQCVDCHSASINSTGALVAAGTHLNKAVEITTGGKIASYTAVGETCTNISCHGGSNAQWGGASLGCRDCHMPAAAAGDQEVDDYTYNNGAMAKVDRDDWYAYGHGATAAFAESGNPAPNFDNGNPGTYNGCLYCHSTTVSHGTGTNPFQLANIGTGTTVAEKNGVCTVCHGGAGYDPDGAGAMPSKDGTLDINAYHYGAAHSATGDGGTFCWDCHDPHGDYNYAATQRLANMIEETPTVDHSGSTGWGIPTTLAPTPDFRNNRDGTAGWAWGDYVSNALVSGTYRGVCQVCHTSASVSYFKQTLYTAGHNNTAVCTAACHKHDQPPSDAFKPAGGNCLGCHNARTGAIPRSQIVGGAAGSEGDDFIRPSRHVSNGTTTSIVTNYDCIVCHTEGDVTSTSVDMKTVAANHGGDSGGTTTVDLRDVDSSGGTGIAVAWPGKRLAAFAATSTDRDSMDTFCMGCHDGDGASAVSVNATNAGLDTAAFLLSNSVTRATSTVTVTTTAVHGLAVGDAVYLAFGEANLPPGWKTVATVPTTTTFTYTEAGSATVNSTRQRTFKRYIQTTATGLSRAASSATVTVTTSAAHGLVAGNTVLLFPGELNKDNSGNYIFTPGLKTVVTAPTTTTFTYAEPASSPNPAAVTLSTVVQRLARPGVTRALAPFNTSDNLTNANETAAGLLTWRTTTNGRIINIKDKFNSANLAGTGFASHHNLNQFTKRYTVASATYPQAAAWAANTTKDGVAIATARDTTGLHCADCHLNEANAHGSRNTWYMLSDATGTDTAFANTGLPTGNDSCFRCHAVQAYGEAGTSSTTAPRTDSHDGDCGRLDGVNDASNTGSTLGFTSTGTESQIPCLKCHGGMSPGLIHGDNGSYYPLKGATVSKRYRFMGTGGSMRWYSPLTAAYNAETDWANNTQYTCYTLTAADTFGGCTQHNGGRNGNAQNGARPLTY